MGAGVVHAVELAVEEMGGEIDGRPIQVLNMDTQLKPDIASTAARKWIDEDHVDVLTLEVAKDADVAVLNAGGISSALSNETYSPMSTHWNIDTYAAARLAVKAAMDAGSKKWFFVTADYSFGHNLEKDASAEVKRLGVKSSAA